MDGKFGVDGLFWPSYKTLQKIAERRSGVSLLFRIKIWIGRVIERRVKK